MRYLTEQQIADHLVACTSPVCKPDSTRSVTTRSARWPVRCGRPAGRLGENATVRLAGCAHRIEHAEMADDEPSPRSPPTGTVASMQPLFDEAWGGQDGLYTRRLGAPTVPPG